MRTLFDAPPASARYRIRNPETGLYLLAPIDGSGNTVPTWERIPECCARFTKTEAQDQRNYLGWQPHKLRVEVTASTTMVD